MVKRATHKQAAAEGLHLGRGSRRKTELPEELVAQAINATQSAEDMLDLVMQHVWQTSGSIQKSKVRSVLTQLDTEAQKVRGLTTDSKLKRAAYALGSKAKKALALVADENTWNQYLLRHNPNVQKAEQEAARAAQAQSTTTQPAQATQQPAAPAQQAAEAKPKSTTSQTSKTTQKPAAPAAPAAPAPQAQPNVQPTQPALGTSQYTVTAPAIQPSMAATSPGTSLQPALLVTTPQWKTVAILQDAPPSLRDILAKSRNVNLLEVNAVSSLLPTGSAKTPPGWEPLKWAEDQRRIGFVRKDAKQQFIDLLRQYNITAYSRPGRPSRTPATPSAAPAAAQQTVPTATPSAAPAAAQQTVPTATPSAAPAATQQTVPAATPSAAPAAAQQAAAQTAAAVTQSAAPSRWQQLRTRLQQMRGNKILSALAILTALAGAYALGHHLGGQQTSQPTILTPDLTQWLQQSTTAEEQLRARQQAYWQNLFRNLLLNQMQLYRTGTAPLPELPEAQ